MPEIGQPQRGRDYGDPLRDVNGLFLKLYNNYNYLILRYHNTLSLGWTKIQGRAHVGRLALAGGRQKTAS